MQKNGDCDLEKEENPTNFLISHFSLWFRSIFDILDQKPITGFATPNWGFDNCARSQAKSESK